MANTTNLNFRVDADLKRQAENVFSELGMNISTALTVFLRQVVNYGGIPFELRTKQSTADDLTALWTLEHWAWVRERLEESKADVAAGRVSDAFESLERLGAKHGI